MDDKDMAHWHGPVYITTTFNERTNPPLFFWPTPLHTYTHIDFYSGIKTHPTTLFTRETRAFLFLLFGGGQKKKKPSQISIPLLAPIGRATFFHFSSLWAFFSLKILTLLFILPHDPGWGAISNLGFSR